MDIRENAAYIKGLSDGLELDLTTKEGKLINALIELTQKMAERIDELEDAINELNEYVEELDEDLGAVEEDFYFDDEEDYDDEEDEDFDSDFEDAFDNDFEDDDSGYDEVVCPSCGEIICVSDTLDIAEVVCGGWGEKLGDVEICDGNCAGCEGCEEEN